MTPEQAGPLAAALGIGAILQAVVARYLSRPGPTGADGRLADAQADKARAEAEALAWTAMRTELDRLVLQVSSMTDAISSYRLDVDRLTAEVERMRAVEAMDKRRIAELEARVRDLESRTRGGGPSALDNEGAGGER